LFSKGDEKVNLRHRLTRQGCLPQTEMLKQVQHDRVGKTFGFCHPGPGPESSSGSIDFGISFLIFNVKWVGRNGKEIFCALNGCGR
jgi:hypothetical protein